MERAHQNDAIKLLKQGACRVGARAGAPTQGRFYKSPIRYYTVADRDEIRVVA